jgi:twitching motility protein PilT
MPDTTDKLERIVAELNQASARNKGADLIHDKAAASSGLLDLLSLAHRERASDLLLVAGAPPMLRKGGRILPSNMGSLEADDIPRLVLPMLSPQQYKLLQKKKTVDIAFSTPALGRFRANIHYQRGTVAVAIRLLPKAVPTLESLHLPESLRRIAALRQGLVLLTGPTGAGKSSTLAALIDVINSKRECHVVTIEEPIEYLHKNRLAVIEQIEVGSDTPGFLTALRSILRQSPDVILVGEMRDAETIAMALRAAETGHLVLSTLHTNDTAQAISRILDAVPSDNQPQIRMQLSLSLAAVIAQQLVPAKQGDDVRYPALEILVATDAIRNLIRQGLDHQIRSQVLISRAAGMITMEQSLSELVRSNLISPETALAHCFQRDELRDLLGSVSPR